MSEAPEPFKAPVVTVASAVPMNQSGAVQAGSSITWDKCLCHCVATETGPLSSFTEQSWQKLWDAASVRQDTTWHFLLGEGFVDSGSQPQGGYHRKCYSSYTHKKALAVMKRKRKSKAETDSKAEESETKTGDKTIAPEIKRQKMTTRSDLPKHEKKACLFCRKTGKKKHRRSKHRTAEPLTECQTFEAAERIHHAAKMRQDECVLREVKAGPDFIASEVVYHASCYRKYTRRIYTQAEDDLDSAVGYKAEHDRAFSRVVEVVQNVVLDTTEHVRVVSIDDLRSQLITDLAGSGITSSYRSSRLKQRLTQHFGDMIQFVRNSVTEPELVVATAVPADALPSVLAKVATECGRQVTASNETSSEGDDQLDGKTDQLGSLTSLTQPDHTYKDNIELFNCAMQLRGSITSMANTFPSVPQPSDITRDNVNVPTALYNFLSWLLMGPESSSISMSSRTATRPDIERRVLSLAQDIIFAVSHGRILTPKHVALPLTVRHLTRSEQVVTLLNRFGHGISDSKLSEIETAMAERALQNGESSTYIPENIDRSSAASAVIFCWDNNDLAEETLSGAGTTHCTNGIIIQRQLSARPFAVATPLPGSNSESVPTTKSSRSRQRSIKAPPVKELAYNAGKRAGVPLSLNAPASTSLEESEREKRAKNTDLLWLLLRMSKKQSHFGRSVDAHQRVPAWSGFNASCVGATTPPTSTVGYLEVIPSSPTELSTVYELLQRSSRIAQQLQQDHCIITLDQAVYAKAIEIVWKKEAEFKNIVLRMGAFHICTMFLAVLGNRFGDAGLTDLLVESEIIGPSAVKAVMSGKHYNRAVRAHKIAFEAFSRLNWQAFEAVWDDEQEADIRASFDALTAYLANMRDPPGRDCSSVLTSTGFKTIATTFWTYSDHQRASVLGSMSAFWRSYLDMVSLLLQFIRATREGDWVLHLACIRRMLPWCFAYDRFNYARYLTLYWSQMECLSTVNPAAHAALSAGEFCVQRTNSKFAQVAVDHAIEQTMNRDTKSKGGIIGFSTEPAAVHRWVVTAHERAAITSACRKLAHEQEDSVSHQHKDVRSLRVARDEDDVLRVIDTLLSWVNPFTQADLVNLSTGTIASAALKRDLLEAHSMGEKALSVFISERLEKKTVNFFEPLHTMQLRTFSADVKIQKATNRSGRAAAMKADRGLFGRMVIMAQARSFDMRMLFKHSLGPIPWSLANADGSPAKTTKAKLLHAIEDGVSPAEEVPCDAAQIIDAMALLQSLTSRDIPRTFAELASLVFLRLVSYLPAATPGLTRRADFVIDQYKHLSIKCFERQRRASLSAIRTVIYRPEQKVPSDWKRYLSNGNNKADLVNFFCEQWQDSELFAEKLGIGAHLFITSGTSCFRLWATRHQGSAGKEEQMMMNVQQVPELTCNHEEADTRLLLHAHHAASNGYNTVIIRSPDTDVALLAAALLPDISAHILFRTGTKQRTRFIDINAVAAKLGREVCSALPGLHAFTGSDTTSAFVGKGKTAALKLVQANDILRAAMTNLGQSFTITPQTLLGCVLFVCALYGRPDKVDVNEVRYLLFCSSALPAHQLPPTLDALSKHVHRSNYQAAVWRRALTARPEIPSPLGNGWKLNNNEELAIDWMEQEPAPKELMQLVSCRCRTGCNSRRCSCLKDSLSCTDACQCTACINPFNHPHVIEHRAQQGRQAQLGGQGETPLETVMQGQQPTVPSQPTGQAGKAPLVEGDSDNEEASDPGLMDSSSEDDDSGI